MYSITKVSRSVGVGVLAATLSACASWFPDTNADSNPAPDERFNNLMREIQEARQNQLQPRGFFAETPWLVGKEVVDTKHYPELDDRRLTMAEHYKTLPEIVPRLSKRGGVSIHLSPDLFSDPNKEEGGQQPVSTDSTGGTTSMSILTSNAMSGSSANDPNRVLERRLSFEVDNGTLTEALDAISAQLGISYRYDSVRDQVTFFRFERATFQVFFPGEASGSFSTGGTDSEDAVITQQANFEFDGGSWDEVEEGINALLSPLGQATVVRSTGNVIVSDMPEAVRRVSEYIEHTNDIYGRQVYLEIKTAAVTMEDTNQFNIAWRNILNAVNGGALGNLQLGLSSPGAPVDPGAANLNVIRSANGASLALQLLATQASSTETNDQAVTTLSNQPASLKVLAENGYIKGIKQSTDLGVTEGVVSEVETDTVNTGFDATLIPRVVNKNAIQLQVALELSGNLQLINFDTTIVQTPTRDRNAVVQRAWLKSGETWVIAAFNSDKAEENKSGAGSPNFWGLGGGQSKSKSGQILLVMVTPHIQDGAYRK